MPGEAGIWVFIAGDMLVFSLFFVAFLYYRSQCSASFEASRAQLNQAVGAINTLLMLTSSWFVALAVRCARSERGQAASRYLALALVCGAGFVIVKIFEYHQKIQAGIGFNSGDFFVYYFMYTGIHLMHVLIGMAVLMFMRRIAADGLTDVNALRNIESGACFWHVVDLLWIVLFALLYLL